MERQLRLFTGLTMATFVTMHLINHGLGLISLEVMETFRKGMFWIWHWPPVSALLYGSVLTHFILALVSLYRRTTLRMSLWEGLQLLLGLSIPPLVLGHAVASRGLVDILGQEASYEFVVGTLWNAPGLSWKQTALVLVVWGHLLIGLHYWLRLRDGYYRWLPLWQTLASLLPILALLGFYRAGMLVGEVDLAARGATLMARNAEGVAFIKAITERLEWFYLASLGAVLFARYLRAVYRINFGSVLIEHPTRGVLTAPVGQTLLEALRNARVPHSAVCGGRARCTTCRVRIVKGAEHLEPPGEEELRALEGVHAETNVRLACQLHLKENLSIIPLIPPESGIHYVRKPGGVEGHEQPVVAMFVDLRASTALGEKRLPYDVVFILNQFFAEMAAALQETGGHYAQFNGDGLMALYGLKSGLESGCKEAFDGACAMLARLEKLNRRLSRELDQPLRMGIGIHSGEAIVGTMGPPESPILSAIGDTINTAARLEASTKHFECTLIVSKETAMRAGVDCARLPVHQIEVRGRQAPLEVLALDDPAEVMDAPQPLQAEMRGIDTG